MKELQVLSLLDVISAVNLVSDGVELVCNWVGGVSMSLLGRNGRT